MQFAQTHHADEDVSAIAERGEDICHQLLVPQPAPCLTVGRVERIGNEQARSGEFLHRDITAVQMALFLVVVVHGVHDVLLAVLDDTPDSAANHVASGERSDGKALSLSLEFNCLAVLQLCDPVEASVHLV